LIGRPTRGGSPTSLDLLIDYHAVVASGLAIGLVFHAVGLSLDLVGDSGLLVLQILAEGKVRLVVPVVDANSIIGEIMPANTVRNSLRGGLDGAGGREGGKVDVNGTPWQITEGQVLPTDRGEREDGDGWVGALFRVEDIKEGMSVTRYEMMYIVPMWISLL